MPVGGARMPAVLQLNVMDTRGAVFETKSISHILHQHSCFGSRLGGTQGNITGNSQHLIPPLSFAMTFFVVFSFSFFFSLMKTAPTGGAGVVPRSERLCCPVSAETLKSYFTLHNAHFLPVSYMD